MDTRADVNISVSNNSKQLCIFGLFPNILRFRHTRLSTSSPSQSPRRPGLRQRKGPLWTPMRGLAGGTSRLCALLCRPIGPPNHTNPPPSVGAKMSGAPAPALHPTLRLPLLPRPWDAVQLRRVQQQPGLGVHVHLPGWQPCRRVTPTLSRSVGHPGGPFLSSATVFIHEFTVICLSSFERFPASKLPQMI